MPTDLPIRCSCGALRGVARGLVPRAGHRVVCYCDDCQAFARAIGRADDVLDGNGGTAIFQTSPGRVEIAEGADRLACLRVTRRGPLRWYASCCGTPVGNTLASGRQPFVGLIETCLDADAPARDAALGPVRMRVFARHARGDLGGVPAHDGASFRMLVRLAPLLLGARLRGDRARSPFFDPETGAPRAAPRTPTDAARRQMAAAARGSRG